MIHPQQLRKYIIRPALESISMWSEAAENLIFGTACVESRCGHFLKQLRNGPGLGVYQMEPATHSWLKTYLARRKLIKKRIITACALTDIPDDEALIYHLRYATAMARLRYWVVPHPLPSANDIEGLALYWKAHYNSYAGKGQVNDFVTCYREFN